MREMKIIAAGILFLAIFKLPYEYYILLRYVIFFIAAISALAILDRHTEIALGYAVIALLFNPIVPIYLDKSTWIIIDILASITFIYTANIDQV